MWLRRREEVTDNEKQAILKNYNKFQILHIPLPIPYHFATLPSVMYLYSKSTAALAVSICVCEVAAPM